MSANFIIQSPYLRTSRNFPQEAQPLSVEINKSYVDIANAVNNRVIGVFAQGRPAISGKSYFISSERQQSIQQLYTFTGTGNVPHGIITNQIASFLPCFGEFTDGTNWYGAIFGSNTAIAGQISFYLTSTNIVILAGAGAPSITSGYIVLEWLANP